MRRALLAGFIWGLFCGVANGWPGATTLVQMAVPWAWLAALVGFGAADGLRRSALVGGVSLLAANVAYFIVGAVARDIADLPVIGGIQFFLLWTAVGLLIGPMSGLVGGWLKSGRTARIAVVLLAALSIAEPVALWGHIDHLDAHLVYIGVAVAGAAFPLIWFRKAPGTALKAFMLTLLLAYPFAVALETALIALGQVSPPMRLL